MIWKTAMKRQTGDQAARLRWQHDMRLSAGQRPGNQHATIVLLLRSHPMPVGLGQRGRTFNHSRIRPVQGIDTRSIQYSPLYRIDRCNIASSQMANSKSPTMRRRAWAFFLFHLAVVSAFGKWGRGGGGNGVISVKHIKRCWIIIIIQNTKYKSDPRGDSHLMWSNTHVTILEFFCCHHSATHQPNNAFHMYRPFQSMMIDDVDVQQ